MNKPIVVAAVFVTLVLAGCAPELVEPIVDPLTLEQISAERPWQRITEDAPFQSYSSWPGDEGVHPGQAPHGSFHSIYINRTLRDALPRSDRIAPFGSVIVKEAWTRTASSPRTPSWRRWKGLTCSPPWSRASRCGGTESASGSPMSGCSC